MMRRRALAAAALLPLGAPALVRAEGGGVLRVIVPYAPGGSSDTLARLLAPNLGTALGQTVVVENRAGAGSMLGTEAAARATADGNTVILSDMPHTIVPAMQPNMPYDPVTDFTPVALLGVAPFAMFANARFAAKDAADFAAQARARPEALAVSSGGSGSASHLVAELFQHAARCKLTHVPYRGAGPAMQDLAAGQVQCSFSTLATASAQMQSGLIRAVGVFAEAEVPELPGVATMRAQGIDLVVEHWWAVLAPARAPAAALQRLAAALARVVASAEVAPRLAMLGVTPKPESPAATRQRIVADVARWKAVVTAAGITP
jgi:tripartite-type tricarboxylate transporter receptor subunit TctC